MYRGMLAERRDDVEVIDKLAALLAAEDRVPELLTLRQIQLQILGHDADSERKLELRLEIAKLVGIVEERGGRLDALKANLEDRPGHEASIDAIAQLLASKAQHRQLADLLETQAQRLESAASRRARPSCGRGSPTSPSTTPRRSSVRSPAIAASSRSRRRPTRCARSRA